MTVRISILVGGFEVLTDLALGVARPSPRTVQPSSVSFSAPVGPAKSELNTVIVEDLGVPRAADDHSGRPPFWGRR